MQDLQKLIDGQILPTLLFGSPHVNGDPHMTTRIPTTSGPGAIEIQEFASIYKISRATTFKEIAAGRLRTKKCGRRTLIRPADAESWLAALPNGNNREASP